MWKELRHDVVKISVAALSLLLVNFSFIPSANASDTRTIDIATVTWSASTPPLPTLASLRSSIDEVSRLWRKFTTFEGQSKDQTLNFTYGATLTDPIALNGKFQCEPSNFSSYISTMRNQAYSRLGISDSTNRYLLLLIPQSGCLWSGRAMLGDRTSKGGTIVLHNTDSAFVIAHEIGHTLGLGHSNLIRCTNSADGPWGSSCSALTYGGAVDVMGNVDTESPLSVYHQWRLGLLESQDIYQSWLNEKITLFASDVATGTRAILLRSGNRTYWVEYRRNLAEMNFNPGIVIYRSDPPPAQSIISPNPSDSLVALPSSAVTNDIWMLNLDSYMYQPTGRATGSMTLPEERSVTLFGDDGITLSFSSGSIANSVQVSVIRKADLNPPPKPVIKDVGTWQSPNTVVLTDNYADGESVVANFDVSVNGSVQRIAPSMEQDRPTYLNPIAAIPTLRVRDLPEGSYSLRLRAIDIWGNIGQYSDPIDVSISHKGPYLGGSYVLRSADSSSARITLLDTEGKGRPLCETNLLNSDGVILSRSYAGKFPDLLLPSLPTAAAATVQVFDCLGYGRQASLQSYYSFIPARDARLNGKWNPQGRQLSCSGRCNATFITSGQFQAVLGAGSATVSISGLPTFKFPTSASSGQRFSDLRSIGPSKKVVRIEGSNFSLYGIAKVEIKWGKQSSIDRIIKNQDQSLSNQSQKALSALGLTATDFDQSWQVSPIPNGTTLNDPTLDICSLDYPSEAGRRERRQVSIVRVDSPYTFLSSEVVRYASMQLANQALDELRNNLAKCKSLGGFEQKDGTWVKYDFPATTFQSPLSASNSVITLVSIGDGQSKRYLLGVFQFKGTYFSGLYLTKDSSNPFLAAEIDRWLYVATLLNQRLESVN